MFHSSKMAMVFMQIVDANTKTPEPMTDKESDSHSMYPSSVELEPITCSNPDSNLNDPDKWKAPAQVSHETEAPQSSPDHTDVGSRVSHLTPSSDCIYRTDPEGDRVVLAGQGHKVAGYVNEMSLNSKALGVVGNMQLTWRWNTEPRTPRRQLILTLGR